MKLITVEYNYEIGNIQYCVKWRPKESELYSDSAANENEKGRKYEVSIFRGGGYKVSFYTDYNCNISNSKDFLNRYLESIK